jgi:large subunit ribosomal protein L24
MINIVTPTKLRSGDEVIVIAGKDLGKKGTLREIIKNKNKGIVTGLNMVKKHTKPNPELGITGGVVEQEAAIDLSNLAIWNPKKKSKDKITYSNNDKGKKIRLYKSDGVEIK